jgi:hypothetical protein
MAELKAGEDPHAQCRRDNKSKGQSFGEHCIGSSCTYLAIGSSYLE